MKKTIVEQPESFDTAQDKSGQCKHEYYNGYEWGNKCYLCGEPKPHQEESELSKWQRDWESGQCKHEFGTGLCSYGFSKGEHYDRFTCKKCGFIKTDPSDPLYQDKEEGIAFRKAVREILVKWSMPTRQVAILEIVRLHEKELSQVRKEARKETAEDIRQLLYSGATRDEVHRRIDEYLLKKGGE